MTAPSTIPLPLTGDSLIDAATHGYYWQLDNSRTIRWSVSGGLHGESWSNPTAVALQMDVIFNTISYYANINFVYTGSYNSPYLAATYSDIAIAPSGSTLLFPSSSMWGRAFFPDSAYNAVYTGAPGDVFLNVNSTANYLPSYAPGSAGYFLFLHEIGHALGLKHPHDDGGTGRPTLGQIGLAEMDNDWFTIMSYGDDYNYNIVSWDPATPMLMDVLGLQYLYGKNMQTNAGDSWHTLSVNGIYETRWVASGNDTIDVSGSSEGWVVILPDTAVSTVVDTKAGLAMPVSDASNVSPTTFSWLAGDIENVYGSNYADVISGTSQDNVFAPNGGNDSVFGGDGNDTFAELSGIDAFYGGGGTDTMLCAFTAAQSGFAKLRDNSFLIKDGPTNMAVCRDIEIIRLTDLTVELNAIGQYAGIDPDLVQIYVAAFKRAPEKDGYSYWAQQKALIGLQGVADVIFSLDVVKAVYPTTQTANSFVSNIYQNVFNKAPDAEGLAYWASQLAAKSRGQLVVDMTNAALGVADGIDGKNYFQNRLDWAVFGIGYLVATNKEATPAYLSSLTTGVTADTTTLLSLVGQVETGLIF